MVNESLIFVEQPTLTQLRILHSVQQDSANPPWWTAKVFHRDQCTE